MKGIGSGRVKARLVLVPLVLSAGCQPQPMTTSAIEVPLYQKWELQPGDTIAGYTVTGGLGDISIVLNGNPVFAPYDGETYADKRGCLYFSTPHVPAYLFRLCGLRSPTVGALHQGQAIGKADILQFAALRKQPDRTWAIVEPDKLLLQRTLKAP
jgi:hypothetical protein